MALAITWKLLNMMQKSTSTIGLSSCRHIIHPCKVICQLGQTSIFRMRDILINWLIEIGFRLKLLQETLYLMITLFDRCLSMVPTPLQSPNTG